MADTNASTPPGLKWRGRKGQRAAYWIARPDYVRRGFTPRTLRIIYDPTDPNHMAHIAARCAVMQAEMLRWSEDNPAPRSIFDGTLASLVRLYESDPDSPYRDLRPVTQVTYSKQMKKLCGNVGGVYLDEINGADVRRWYKSIAAESSVSYAYLIVGIFKAVLSYGATLGKGYEVCAILRSQVAAARFKNGAPRTQRLTYSQVAAFRNAAHADGRPSMALGVTLQAECTLRQRDVIGMWLRDPDGAAAIRNGQHVWRDGLTWSHLDPDGVLRKVTSKTGGLSETTIADFPDLVAELERTPRDRRVGPLVINETTGLPYTDAQYRHYFRRIARLAGIPDDVKNMDARAGAITEAYEAGAEAIGVMAAATHTQLPTSRRYNRTNVERVSTVSKLRVGSREREKNKS